MSVLWGCLLFLLIVGGFILVVWLIAMSVLLVAACIDFNEDCKVRERFQEDWDNPRPPEAPKTGECGFKIVVSGVAHHLDN